MTVPGNLSSPLLATAAAGAAAAAGPIKSLRFNNGDSAYLNRTPSSAGNRKTWTLSLWLKRAYLGNWQTLFFAGNSSTNTKTDRFRLYLRNDDQIELVFGGGTGSVGALFSPKLRDTSAWYHLVFAIDMNQSARADGIKLYINGIQADAPTESGNVNYSTFDTAVNNNVVQEIGRNGNNSEYFGGYIADCIMVDGSQLDPTSFGAFDSSGVWQAAAYSGTFGTNGFHLLDFASESTVGHDSSGNENDFTANNLVADGSKGSWYFNGSAGITGTMTALGNQNWTVEMFIEKTSSTGQEALFSFSSDNPTFETDQPSKVRWMSSSVYGSTLAQNTRYHIAWVRNSNKGYIYVDGTLISPSSGIDYSDNDTNTSFSIGERTGGTTGFTGYIDNVRVVVGTAVYTSNFTVPSTPLTAVSNTKLLTLTSASLSDTSGQNVSLTNGGAVEEFAISQDVLFDVPVNGTQSDTGAGGEVSGNYATLNPLDSYSGLTLSNGNLTLDHSSGGSIPHARATIGMTSGKWYFEVTRGTGTYGTMGIATQASDLSNYAGRSSNAVGGYEIYTENTEKWAGGSGGSSSGYLTEAWDSDGDVASCYFDADNGTIGFMVNGTDMGVAFTGIDMTKTYFFQCGSQGTELHANFGQRPFSYSKSGYKPLCSTLLPTPTIPDGSDYFDTKLYTGTGATQSITGLEFSPDMVWIKRRSGTASHVLNDIVRGAGKQIRPDLTDAEATNTNNFAAFTSDGFTVGTGSGTNASSQTHVAWAWDASANSNKTYTVKVVSDSGNKYRFDDFGTSAVTLDLAEGSTYIFDQSDSSNSGHPIRFGTSANGTDYTTGVTHTGTPGSAGAKTTLVLGTGVATLYYSCANHSGMGGQINTNSTGGASNFDGSIQATVKANPEAGFSIVEWTPTQANGTIGHGLNAAPEFVITKSKTSGSQWFCFHSALGGTKAIALESTGAAVTTSSRWNDTAPTNSVVHLGDGGTNYYTSDSAIAYCFAPVAGYSAIGSYTGSSSFPFVYCGFRPAFIILKKYDGGDKWCMYDTARGAFNTVETQLYPNEGGAETAAAFNFDILSNGFRPTDTSGQVNQNGNNYIFYAVAENPFQANGGLAR